MYLRPSFFLVVFNNLSSTKMPSAFTVILSQYITSFLQRKETNISDQTRYIKGIVRRCFTVRLAVFSSWFTTLQVTQRSIKKMQNVASGYRFFMIKETKAPMAQIYNKSVIDAVLNRKSNKKPWGADQNSAQRWAAKFVPNFSLRGKHHLINSLLLAWIRYRQSLLIFYLWVILSFELISYYDFEPYYFMWIKGTHHPT